MCGIFFSVGFENLPAAVIDSVAHRGPDGRGWNEFMSPNGPVVMAHRRLAIVDLSADGHQPMSTEDQRFWVTYNGEIYNYLEIRGELEDLGHEFKTKTDTEVLLKSYLHWGKDCLHKFNGMFAFVIWDDKEKKVFAARDRFGVKPLYYYREGNKIAFSSEIKQFKHFPKWKNILNQEMAGEYLETGYCDHKQITLYKNVFQVLPGHYLKSDCLVNIPDPLCWYNLESCIKHLDISDNDAISHFKKLFEDAVRIRLRSDVLVGACLSGGLDSSSIVCMMREIQGVDQKISTFSSVFPGEKVDESNYIDELASQKNLTSYKNYPSSHAFMDNLDSVLYHQDLPFLGTSIFAQWSTFESAKEKGVIVLLNGQGADESLLGYPGMLNGASLLIYSNF
jgi:asparagine synthase (glutamine-hydrolysing)